MTSAAPSMPRVLAGLAAASLALASCAGTGQGGTEVRARTLTVFAAASLTDVVGTLEADFEAEHPDVDVVVVTAGSSDLVAQIDQGAPADVLATADTATMGQAASAGLLAGEPRIMATNELTIAVPAGNPAGISGLTDLVSDDVAVVRCAVPVPCGTLTDELLRANGIRLTPVSEEQSVTDVLGKVSSGEADAGLVYVSDIVRSHGAVEQIDIPGAEDHLAEYPIAVTADAAQPDLAAAFLALVTGPDGRAVLADAGYGAPR